MVQQLAGKRRRQTILVVEDNVLILNPVMRTLRQAGFTVLSAATGEQAIRMETEFGETIHLLLSSVLLPDMTGPDLARKLKQLRPTMSLMLMVGYPHRGMLILNLTHGWYFLQKPFGGGVDEPAALIHRVKHILSSALGDQVMDYFGTFSRKN